LRIASTAPDVLTYLAFSNKLGSNLSSTERKEAEKSNIETFGFHRIYIGLSTFSIEIN
jgi:hypothetical protein